MAVIFKNLLIEEKTEEEKQHMDLGEYNMVAVVESITYLSNGNILQYGILTYRPDKFTFVTMAKR